jgi:DNA-binding MarR family transcriptional regulator
MSARETAELLLMVGRLVQFEGYDGGLSPAQWMALRFFARANSFSRTPSAFAEFQATTRGTASQAIKALEAGGYLVRQRSEADGRSVTLRLKDKGKKSDCARSVRSSGARRGRARRARANRNARRPAPGVDHASCEWSASTVRCLPGLHVPGWRYLLHLNECEPVGTRMLTVRRSDRAGGRWSPLRPFSTQERAPRGRTSRMSSPLRKDA